MKKLKMGMVGGGIGAFIGEVHRKAARMDGGADIVAGAFDVDPEKSLERSLSSRGATSASTRSASTARTRT